MKKKTLPIVRSGRTSAAKIQQVLNGIITDLEEASGSRKHHASISSTEDGICISSVIGDVCMNVSFVPLMIEGGQA